jgi:hypothetical protein
MKVSLGEGNDKEFCALRHQHIFCITEYTVVLVPHAGMNVQLAKQYPMMIFSICMGHCHYCFQYVPVLRDLHALYLPTKYKVCI